MFQHRLGIRGHVQRCLGQEHPCVTLALHQGDALARHLLAYRGPEAAMYAQIMDALRAEAVTGEPARRLIVQAIQALHRPA